MPAQLIQSPGLRPVFPTVLYNISAPNNIVCGPDTPGNYTYVFNNMINTDIHTDLTLITIMLSNGQPLAPYPTIVYTNGIEQGVYSSSNVKSGAYNQFTDGQAFYNINNNAVLTIPSYNNVNTSLLSTIEPLINDIQPYWTTGNQQYYIAINTQVPQGQQVVIGDPPGLTGLCMALQRLIVVIT
ncbi:MAG: hypothetical protein QXU98_07810 [Candidatus Parvarchaeota archaeon]